MTKTSVPRGQPEVRAALISAAADIYAEGGPFSVRAIARRAGVNHGLVHHYFGSKEGLRGAMLEHLAAGLDAGLAGLESGYPNVETLATQALFRLREDPRFLRVLARSMLEGELPESFQNTYPVVRRLLTAMKRAHSKEPKVKVAAGLAAAFGWVLFEAWIRQAAQLNDRDVARVEQYLLSGSLTSLEA